MTWHSSSSPLLALLALGVVFVAPACGRGTASPDSLSGGPSCIGCGTGAAGTGAAGTADGGGDGAGGRFGRLGEGDFELIDEWTGPCERADVIDVNLGHSAEAAVRALHCQVHGTDAPAELVNERATALRDLPHVRRIDVARGFCQAAGRQCQLGYSDPWQAQVVLEAGCTRKTSRDLGAVFMFFSDCPGGVNCSMDWANTHAHGMDGAHVLYAFEPNVAGFYNPGNPGFWRRELLDARWAGLQFVLLNVYGPDLQREPYALTQLGLALEDIGGGIQVALFDDTWNWGRGPEEPWATAPDLADTEAAAQKIFQNKWKPFYSGIAAQHWYTYESRPFIYFYNAGTLAPRDQAAAVVRRLKELFVAEFGSEPFVAVDTAFFQDESMESVADGRFRWDTFRDEGEWSREQLGGVTLDHGMVRWDAVGRDRPGQLAQADDRMQKGPELLESFLEDSATADIAVIATWNDLGEGTGIGRNYDYYSGDGWLPPHAFMSLTRAAQCSN